MVEVWICDSAKGECLGYCKNKRYLPSLTDDGGGMCSLLDKRVEHILINDDWIKEKENDNTMSHL